MNMLETFKGEISGIAFGGQGICRQGQLVVFIPFTAIGDIILFRITERKKNFAFGELIEILQESQQRSLPQCPYFGTCGGCQLQHLQYAAQLEYKRQAIEDAIKRQAKLVDAVVPPVIPASQQWAYRRRISLSLAPHHGRLIAGYMAIDNVSLVQVQQCPIFCIPSDPIINILQEIAQSLYSDPDNQAKATILKEDQGKYMLHLHFKMMPSNAAEILDAMSKQHACLSGIVATAPNKILQFGALKSTLEIEGLTFAFSPRAFIQSHPEQSLNIYRSLCRHALLLTPPKGRVLDLYCGIGISSLLIARQGIKVTGVETNGEAIQLAKCNAQNNGITNADFIQGNVEKILTMLLKKISPDTVIVNPPREGLHPEVVRALLKSPPSSVLYISCMPPTLARDLKILCAETYQLKGVEGYDMFPQTSHVETLAILSS
jgi:23S rRNA (uracil1939-C5)-methyltransferase